MAGIRQIPFELSRNSSESLTDQMVAGFRFAISSGYYSPGEMLPPLRTIADILGVSMIVSRTAMSRLVDEGLVQPHPGRGSEVIGAAAWRGHVLFVVPDRNDSYHVSIVCDVLRRRLLAAGYFFNQITVTRGRDGVYDLSQLKLQLKDPNIFVVEMFAVPEISRAVVAAGVRSLVIVRGRGEPYRGAQVVRFDPGAAVPEFVARCVSSRVRSVLQIGFEYGAADASVALDEAGISVDTVCVAPPGSQDGVIATVKRATLDFFDKFFAKKTTLPDLIYFTDDHAAEAGFLALALRSVEVPQDVRVVSWSNKGLAPVYAKSVARMEVDPFANGEALAKCILGQMAGRGRKALPAFEAYYIDGETFPVKQTIKQKRRG